MWFMHTVLFSLFSFHCRIYLWISDALNLPFYWEVDAFAVTSCLGVMRVTKSFHCPFLIINTFQLFYNDYVPSLLYMLYNGQLHCSWIYLKSNDYSCPVHFYSYTIVGKFKTLVPFLHRLFDSFRCFRFYPESSHTIALIVNPPL